MILETGTQIGDYRILKRIGKGTYGIVFEAEHVITQRVEALKVLLDGACSPDDEQRFLREIQIQASLQHPNIAVVHTAFRTPSGLVLVMERVPGESLRNLLDRGRVSLREGLRYMLEALAGLGYAERAGVIHRDIKPENILITPTGAVKITDFGLAHVMNRSRLTGSGESLGTPMYISPEQIDGLGEVDARTNVYSTAVVLYEVLTGRPPFSGPNGFAVMRAHREMPPPPPMKLAPAIGERLNAVILKALEKDPARRFSNSSAFRMALEAAMAPAPASAPARSVLRRPRLAVAAMAGFGVCSATVAGGYWGLRQTPQPVGPVAAATHAAAIPGAAAGAASVPSPTATPFVSDAHAPSQPAAVRPKRTARAAAKPLPPDWYLPRITSMEDDAPAEPPPGGSLVAEPPKPAVVVEMPVAQGQSCPAPPRPAVPPPAVIENHRRNAVVRALSKVFHKRAAQSASPDGAPAAPKSGQ